MKGWCHSGERENKDKTDDNGTEYKIKITIPFLDSRFVAGE